jgi:hypothetical protein
MAAAAQAAGIRDIEKARVDTDAERMNIYRNLPSQVMLGLAARELAGNLRSIDHLNLGGDGFGPLLVNLIQSGIRHLESPPAYVAAINQTPPADDAGANAVNNNAT